MFYPEQFDVIIIGGGHAGTKPPWLQPEWDVKLCC